MNKINNLIQDVLLYDLQNIVIDYLDDTHKNNMKKLNDEFEYMVIDRIEDICNEDDVCVEPGRYTYNACSGCDSLKEMKNKYPECYEKHINCLNELINNGNLFYLNDWKHKEEINELNGIMKSINWCQ